MVVEVEAVFIIKFRVEGDVVVTYLNKSIILRVKGIYSG